MKKIYSLIVVALVLVSSSLSAVTHTIEVSNYQFSPQGIIVNVGDVIHWQWLNGSHTTTSLLVPSGAASWDEELDSDNPTFDYTVEVPGTYGYYCTPHSKMGMNGGFQANGPNQVEAVTSSSAAVEMVAGVDMANHVLHVTIENAMPAHAVLQLLDITGKSVAVLMNNELGGGNESLRYDISAHGSGVYFLRLEQNGKAVTRKLLLN